MPRRNSKDAGDAVSLFPFLSILACVIGTLTLMITALALGQLDNPAIADAAQLDSAQRSAEEDEALIDQLRQQIEEQSEGAEEDQQKLAAAKTRLAAVKDDVSQVIEDRAEMLKQPPPAPPQIDPAKQKQEREQLAAEIADQEKTSEQLAAELAARGEKPEEAIVSIRPGGSGKNLEPSFVECTPGSIVIHGGDKPHRVRRADLSADETWLTLLKSVADSDEKTVIFLVREDAMSMYFAARGVAQAKYARNGKLPVIGQGKLDLSLFR